MLTRFLLWLDTKGEKKDTYPNPFGIRTLGTYCNPFKIYVEYFYRHDHKISIFTIESRS